MGIKARATTRRAGTQIKTNSTDSPAGWFRFPIVLGAEH